MADWSLIETTLETWIENITGLPTQWRGRQQVPTYSNSGYALLSISSIVTRGVDEVYTEYDDGEAEGEEIRSWQRGQRTFTFGVQIRASRQSVDNDAKHYTSLINDSLRLPVKTFDVLSAADVAIARVLQETDVSEIVDSRDLSIAQLDIRMNARSEVEDTPTAYIETLKTTVIKDGDDNTLWTGDISLA